MSPNYLVPIFIIFILLYFMARRQKTAAVKNIIKKRKKAGKTEMIELAEKFIDKECLIYTFDSHQIEGIIRDVADGAMMIESKGQLEVINLDFVLRIREFPKNKNGKKKSIVLD